MESKWYEKGVVYQIYPRSFFDSNDDGIGDIKGIIEKIPYLVDLGVDIVWLSPVYKSPMKDFGYDISDYQDIASCFGTMDDIYKLIALLHESNIKLVMDLVINHTSDEHPWFIKSKNKEGKYIDYYHWEKKKRNWTSFFGSKAWSYDETRKEYYLHLFAPSQPDLNWDNELVREDIKKMIRFWLDAGVDGFRCDVINLIAKNNTHPNGKLSLILTGKEHYLNHPNLHVYLKELYQDVFSKYDCFTVGETVFVNPKQASLLVNKDRSELNMLFQFEHMGADNFYVKWFIKKFKPINLKKPLSKWQHLLKGWNTLYLENHDQGRSINRFGNLEYYYESATLLATILYFQKGTPFIYQGQEIGMTNASWDDLTKYQDIETKNIYKLGRKIGMSHHRMMKKIKLMSRDNARTPMQWSMADNAGFSKVSPWLSVNDNYKEINVLNSQNEIRSIYKYYQSIIQLRKNHEVLIYGEYEDIDFSNKKIYAYKRQLNNEKIYVICNFSNKQLKIKDYHFLDYHLILQNYSEIDRLMLKPYESRVYHLCEKKSKEIIDKFWQEFQNNTDEVTPDTYVEYFHFDLNRKDSDFLLDLVLKGKKQATASSLYYFEKTGEKIPEVGDYFIVTDFEGLPKGVIKTTEVTIVPFKDLDFETVKREGEDKNLKSWQSKHKRFFTQDGEQNGYDFSLNMPVVFEDFKLVYKK